MFEATNLILSSRNTGADYLANKVKMGKKGDSVIVAVPHNCCDYFYDSQGLRTPLWNFDRSNLATVLVDAFCGGWTYDGCSFHIQGLLYHASK